MIYMKITRIVESASEQVKQKKEKKEENHSKSQNIYYNIIAQRCYTLYDAFNITWYIILRATFQKPYNNVSVLYICNIWNARYRITRWYYIDKNSWSHTNAHKIYINMIYSWKTAHFYWFEEQYLYTFTHEHTWNVNELERNAPHCSKDLI